jgi:hypothetical protein
MEGDELFGVRGCSRRRALRVCSRRRTGRAVQHDAYVAAYRIDAREPRPELRESGYVQRFVGTKSPSDATRVLRAGAADTEGGTSCEDLDVP